MNHVKKYKKVLILLGTACVIYVSFCYILPLVVPFVLALVFAKALQPWTKKIHTATHLNRKVCSVLMVVVSLGALGCFLFYERNTGCLFLFIDEIFDYGNLLKNLGKK